jgi:hypothetical protein
MRSLLDGQSHHAGREPLGGSLISEDGRRQVPKAHKLGPHLSSHPVWRVAEILAWFESYGLPVTKDSNREDKSDPASCC